MLIVSFVVRVIVYGLINEVSVNYSIDQIHFPSYFYLYSCCPIIACLLMMHRRTKFQSKRFVKISYTFAISTVLHSE